MTDETITLPPEDGLLDLLLVIAGNARLLIFGPLLADLAALGIAFIIPPTFTAASAAGCGRDAGLATLGAHGNGPRVESSESLP